MVVVVESNVVYLPIWGLKMRETLGEPLVIIALESQKICFMDRVDITQKATDLYTSHLPDAQLVPCSLSFSWVHAPDQCAIYSPELWFLWGQTCLSRVLSTGSGKYPHLQADWWCLWCWYWSWPPMSGQVGEDLQCSGHDLGGIWAHQFDGPGHNHKMCF